LLDSSSSFTTFSRLKGAYLAEMEISPDLSAGGLSPRRRNPMLARGVIQDSVKKKFGSANERHGVLSDAQD
jgi:hypothetical protein